MLIQRTSTTSNKIKNVSKEIITFNFFIQTNEDILRSYQNNGFTIMNGHILQVEICSYVVCTALNVIFWNKLKSVQNIFVFGRWSKSRLS